MSVLWKCDFCGGPAAWTLHPDGSPLYHCDAQCDGFMQMDFFDQILFGELFLEDGVPLGTRGDDTVASSKECGPPPPEEGLPF